MSNRTAPLSLWQIAQTFLNTLYALFGAPESVAFQHTHTAKQRALFLPWLRAGEALMRRLLLIEAQAFPKPNTRPLLRAARKRVRTLMDFDADEPQTWRVCFRAFAAAERRRPAAPKARRQDAAAPQRRQRLSRFERAWREPKPVTFYATRPLAERYEALIRVFNDPAPFAKRLAARLHATPHRAGALMRLPVRRRARRSGETADIADLIPDFASLDQAANAALNSS